MQLVHLLINIKRRMRGRPGPRPARFRRVPSPRTAWLPSAAACSHRISCSRYIQTWAPSAAVPNANSGGRPGECGRQSSPVTALPAGLACNSLCSSQLSADSGAEASKNLQTTPQAIQSGLKAKG